MEVLAKIAAIPGMLLNAMSSLVAVIALIVFASTVAAVAVALFTDVVPQLLGIFGSLAEGLVAALKAKQG